MEFKETDIKGVYIVESYIFEDNRGGFVKNFEKGIFEDNGIEFNCDEDFISTSSKYVIRGMHFQLNKPQKKIVSVICGKVYDVVVDLRKDSETYGQWRGYYLSSNNRNSLVIPRGCAHGFISLADESIVSYKCDGKYDKETDTGIMYDDPQISIEWPVPDGEHVIIGSRDKKLMSFEEFDKNCDFVY